MIGATPAVFQETVAGRRQEERGQPGHQYLIQAGDRQAAELMDDDDQAVLAQVIRRLRQDKTFGGYERHGQPRTS